MTKRLVEKRTKKHLKMISFIKVESPLLLPLDRKEKFCAGEVGALVGCMALVAAKILLPRSQDSFVNASTHGTYRF